MYQTTHERNRLMPTILEITDHERLLLLELYKCHYSATDAANYMDIKYHTISHVYRGFKLAGIEKYDRLQLIPSTTRETLNLN